MDKNDREKEMEMEMRCKGLPNLTRSDDDVVDWDEDEFYKEAYESHHDEPNRCTKCYLREF